MLQHWEDVFAQGITYMHIKPLVYTWSRRRACSSLCHDRKGFSLSLLPGFNHPVLSSWFLWLYPLRKYTHKTCLWFAFWKTWAITKRIYETSDSQWPLVWVGGWVGGCVCVCVWYFWRDKGGNNSFLWNYLWHLFSSQSIGVQSGSRNKGNNLDMKHLV